LTDRRFAAQASHIARRIATAQPDRTAAEDQPDRTAGEALEHTVHGR
jgi:hypothetical protein